MWAQKKSGYHGHIIKEICKYSNCETYLELGVYDGETFNMIVPHVKRAIGVDIIDKRKIKNGEFYECTTDTFFSKFKDEVNIIFIDADHKYESVITDFEKSLKILSKYGIIFLHDTDPMNIKLLGEGYCNDCYKMVDYIKNNHPELDCVTLPITDAGLSIVKRKNDRRILEFI